MELYTVAVLKPGAKRLAPVGPTSHDRVLLGATLKLARAKYSFAMVVPWDKRFCSIRTAKSMEAKRKAMDQLMRDVAQRGG